MNAGKLGHPGRVVMNGGGIIGLRRKSIALPGRRRSLWLEPDPLRVSRLRAQDIKQHESQEPLLASHA
ncbi:MAG: hypothetical protein CAF45_010190 [Nitrospira sp. CG24E]|nr:MAG: hypothetical protein CAF45_010190 [Nitrospira sp. CG24E]